VKNRHQLLSAEKSTVTVILPVQEYEVNNQHKMLRERRRKKRGLENIKQDTFKKEHGSDFLKI